MNLTPYLIFGAPCVLALGAISYPFWLTWKRERLKNAIIASASSVLHAWVEPPNDMYAVFRLKVKTLRGCTVVAVHTEIPEVLMLLEQNSVPVHDAPDWCRDSSMEPPPVEFEELGGGTFSLIVNGIISPALLLGLLGATVWAMFRG